MSLPSASRAVVFIVADESVNGGERDYMKAIAAEIEAQGRKHNTKYLVYKLPPVSGAAVPGQADILPMNDAQYAAVPRLSPQGVFDGIVEGCGGLPADAQVVGVGHSTRAFAAEVCTSLRGQGCFAVSAWITHNQNAEEMRAVAEKNMQLFSPITAEDLLKIAPEAEAVRLVPLDAVPHTNSTACIAAEYDAYFARPESAAVFNILSSRDTFALSVLNAGFEEGIGADRKFHPYTEEEAYKHGYALGDHMAPGTHLILAHGGPRNLRDERPDLKRGDTHQGQATMELFVEGYCNAQEAREGYPTVACERFVQGGSNTIKVFYEIVRRYPDRMSAFISNNEGYATKDGATLYVDNQKSLLGAFPFEAEKADPSGGRERKTQEYNRLGVAILTIGPNLSLQIARHPQEGHTPRQGQDAAKTVVMELKLARSPAPTAVMAPRALRM